MSGLLRLFPEQWRAAYGEEVAEMLTASRSPWRDRADLLRAAGVRGRQLADLLTERKDHVRYLGVVGLGLIALGLGGVWWAVPRLAHGLVEIPQHWWSTLAVLPLIAGTALAVVAWWPRRRVA